MDQPGTPLDTCEDKQLRLRQQELLVQVMQALAASLNLSLTLPEVTRIIQAAAGVPAACITAEVDTQTLRFAAGPLADHALNCEAILRTRLESSLPIPVLLTDAQDMPGGSGAAGASVQTAAAWPLVDSSGSTRGLLWIASDQPELLSEYAWPPLGLIANQIAGAIQNAQAYQRALNGRKWLAAILASTADPVMVVDSKHQLSLLNQAAQDVLQLDPAVVINQPIHVALRDYPILLQILGNAQTLTGHEEWESPDGRFYSPRLSTVDTVDGEESGCVLTLQDVTAYKLLNHNQAEFVRLVSHDLRSPLTFMQGYADLVGMVGDLNEQQASFLEKVIGGIQQVTALVDNIQDAGRWDPQTGLYEMSREPVDLPQLVHDILSIHQDLAQKNGIKITTDIAPGIPIVNVDKLMIERALTNLVTNAIKYSPEGGEITASITVRNNTLEICIKDTGLGIAPEHLSQIFKRGARIVTDAVKQNRIKGSGLGLFIVHSVAQRHHGKVWVESTLGEGSRFYFSLPLAGTNLLGGQ